MRLFSMICALLAAFVPALAAAHEVRPAYLEIVETQPGTWAVSWKQPVMGERALRLEPHLSNGWLDRKPVSEELAPTHYLRTWRIEAPDTALAGETVSVAGLDNGMTDVLVHVRNVAGEGNDSILRKGSERKTIDFGGRGPPAVPAYLQLGVHHILIGIDHLMFVFGLFLLVGTGWRLVGAITSFTLAHSVTLAASALGLVSVNIAVIEALIAWSIVYVAFELTRVARGRIDLTGRFPWVMALVFGLLHGFGFAGALAETGLPEGDIPMALLLFNVGVEIGQLLFVGALLLLALAWRRLAGHRRDDVERGFVGKVAPYALGCYASFLFVERSVAALV